MFSPSLLYAKLTFDLRMSNSYLSIQKTTRLVSFPLGIHVNTPSANALQWTFVDCADDSQNTPMDHSVLSSFFFR
uniref:Ovule protein n=1 Tax=Caenorhabditis tropicalis TaxID=1561998 RepID=A0A1I7UF12_9PELO